MNEKIGPFELGKVHCVDCLEAMTQLPEKCVDHVLTDPPYDTKTHRGTRYEVRPTSSEVPFAPLGDVPGVVEALLRVTRRWALAFCALEMFHDYAVAAGCAWVRAGLWRRTDGAPQFTGDRPGQAAEGIAVMHSEGKKQWNGGGKHGVWTHGLERKERVHPTQKPVGLIAELLKDFTDPGDLILDPFAGSGTTGVACVRTGRRFLGFEIDPKYTQVANQRIAATQKGVTLKEHRRGQASLFKAE